MQSKVLVIIIQNERLKHFINSYTHMQATLDVSAHRPYLLLYIV